MTAARSEIWLGSCVGGMHMHKWYAYAGCTPPGVSYMFYVPTLVSFFTLKFSEIRSSVLAVCICTTVRLNVVIKGPRGFRALDPNFLIS